MQPVANELIEADEGRAAPPLGSATRDLHCDQRLPGPCRPADDDAVVQRGELEDWLLLDTEKAFGLLFPPLNLLACAEAALANRQTGADN